MAPIFKNTVLLLFAVFLAIFWGGCLQRDNPWDPLNRVVIVPDSLNNPNWEEWEILPDSIKGPIENTAGAFINPYLDSLNLLITQIQNLKADFNMELTQREALFLLNDSIFAANEIKTQNNANVDSLTQTSCYTLKSTLDYLTFVGPINSASTADFLESELDRLWQTSHNYLDSIRGRYADTTLLSGHLFSLTSIYQQAETSLGSFNLSLDSSNANYQLANDTIIAYNNDMTVQNSKVVDYNRAVERSPQYCNVRLSDPFAIQQSMNNLGPGDSLFLDSGIIEIQAVLQVSGDSGAPIVLVGDTAGGTVFTSALGDPLLIDNVQNIEIHNIRFSGGVKSGLKLVNSSGPVRLVNCAFENNAVKGLESLDSDIEVINCRFIGNTEEGIFFTATMGGAQTFSFDNILVAGNGSHGISGLTIEGTLSHSTITNNRRDGFYINVPQRTVRIEKSIFAANDSSGLHRAEVDGAEGALELDSVAIFGNGFMGLQSLPPYDSLVYIELDPQFVDSLDYLPNAPEMEGIGYRRID